MSLRAIIKKWYVILMCAALCAGGLYYEKSRAVPVIPQTGDMTYIRVVKFNQVPVESLNDTNVEIKLDPLVKAWPNLSELSKQMDSQLDMKKFNPKWGGPAGVQKVQLAYGTLSDQPYRTGHV